jgi:hypothetical protein
MKRAILLAGIVTLSLSVSVTCAQSNNKVQLQKREKGDKNIGERALAPYVIEYRNSIGRVSCIKMGNRPYVKYKFSRNGEESNNISDLLMQGSSGSERTGTSFTGFEQVTFPFKGKVTFKAPSSFMTSILTCELRLVINDPGSWIVTIFY